MKLGISSNHDCIHETQLSVSEKNKEKTMNIFLYRFLYNSGFRGAIG
jgi:hypothetical protein